MADPQIIQYVQDSIGQGVPPEEIRNALLKQGWPAEEVEEALAYSGQGPGFRGDPLGLHPNSSFSEVIAGILQASEKQYSELYLYKVILQVCVFSAASFVLVFLGLPWFVPLVAAGVLASVAYMQIGKAKRMSGLRQQVQGTANGGV